MNDHHYQLFVTAFWITFLATVAGHYYAMIVRRIRRADDARR
jgi:hypothetical protein